MAASMTRIMERHRLLDMNVAATLLIMLSSCATGQVNMTKATDINGMIAALVAAPPNTLAQAEAALGVSLKAAPTQNVFRQYQGRKSSDGDGRTIDIEYRLPQSVTATSGPLLIMKIDGACLTKAEVQSRFGPLALTEVPRGKSLDEETGFSRNYDWGTLYFGFSERSRDCVRTVSYNLNKK